MVASACGSPFIHPCCYVYPRHGVLTCYFISLLLVTLLKPYYLSLQRTADPHFQTLFIMNTWTSFLSDLGE